MWWSGLVIVLAVHQTVNIFRYSSLFASVREWRDLGCFGVRPDWLQAKVRELLGCPWCLSVHVALWEIAVFTAMDWLPPGIAWLAPLYVMALLGRWVIYALAASQVANLLHWLTEHRGPKHE